MACIAQRSLGWRSSGFHFSSSEKSKDGSSGWADERGGIHTSGIAGGSSVKRLGATRRFHGSGQVFCVIMDTIGATSASSNIVIGNTSTANNS